MEENKLTQENKKQVHYSFLNFLWIGSIVLLIIGTVVSLVWSQNHESFFGAFGAIIFIGPIIIIFSFIQLIVLSFRWIRDKHLDPTNKVIFSISSILLIIAIGLYIENKTEEKAFREQCAVRGYGC